MSSASQRISYSFRHKDDKNAIQPSLKPLAEIDIRYRIRCLELENRKLMQSNAQAAREQQNKIQVYLREISVLRMENNKLHVENRELRDLCCYIDDQRQHERRIAADYNRQLKLTSRVVQMELQTYSSKLTDLEYAQKRVLSENAELKELCLHLDTKLRQHCFDCNKNRLCRASTNSTDSDKENRSTQHDSGHDSAPLEVIDHSSPDDRLDCLRKSYEKETGGSLASSVHEDLIDEHPSQADIQKLKSYIQNVEKRLQNLENLQEPLKHDPSSAVTVQTPQMINSTSSSGTTNYSSTSSSQTSPTTAVYILPKDERIELHSESDGSATLRDNTLSPIGEVDEPDDEINQRLSTLKRERTNTLTKSDNILNNAAKSQNQTAEFRIQLSGQRTVNPVSKDRIHRSNSDLSSKQISKCVQQRHSLVEGEAHLKDVPILDRIVDLVKLEDHIKASNLTKKIPLKHKLKKNLWRTLEERIPKPSSDEKTENFDLTLFNDIDIMHKLIE